MSTLFAARGQMTLSLVFHIVFAAIGIGLPALLVVVEGAYLRTGQEHLNRLAHKWAKATGLLFAIGAVSGTALAVELGLLWPDYIAITGAVVGQLFGLEGYAFFVEAIFIGLYLYGWDKLSPRAHWWCGVVIAVSGAASGILVLGVNSWMQLPVGFHLDAGKVIVTNPLAIFARAGWVYMAIHSTLSCYAAVGFGAAGVYALGWLRGRRDAYHRDAIRIALAIGGVAAILQPLSGDLLAKFVFRTQPAKFAAMEADYHTQRYAPIRIGGIRGRDGEVHYDIPIPGGLSFLATHHFDAEVTGLDRIPQNDWPNVEVTHAAFDVMVGLGTLMMFVSIWFWLAWWRKREKALAGRWLARAILWLSPAGFLALEAGWVVTEAGRQPWVINGVMRTSDAVTHAHHVPAMFAAFTVLYLLLGVTTVYLLLSLRHRPEAPEGRGGAPQEFLVRGA